MRLSRFFLGISFLGPALANADYDTDFLPAVKWSPGEYTIHESCNATESLQLRRALNEMLTLVEHAKVHILQYGNESEIYRKYFGTAATAEPIGWYERVLNANRSAVLFRCDDPDENCATQAGWAGHWRGSNATQETVICPRSYETRASLTGICSFGYNVSSSPTNFFFASDLLHRVFHVPQISEESVEHYAEDYEGVIELAVSNPSQSVRDSDTLQYFALEVFSYAVFPDQGCPGEQHEVTGTVSATPTGPTTLATSVTSSAASHCHTHADGFVHC